MVFTNWLQAFQQSCKKVLELPDKYYGDARVLVSFKNGKVHNIKLIEGNKSIDLTKVQQEE